MNATMLADIRARSDFWKQAHANDNWRRAVADRETLLEEVDRLHRGLLYLVDLIPNEDRELLALIAADLAAGDLLGAGAPLTLERAGIIRDARKT